MGIKKFLSLLAVGSLFVVFAPSEGARAASLISPVAASAIHVDTHELTTEVRWRHSGWRHRGWHRHWGWRHHRGWRHHWGWRRHHRHWRW